MKKFIPLVFSFISFSTWSAAPEIDQLSKSDLEKVGNEFAVNFSHTAVAAPETDGLWGVEVGMVAGSTGSPKLKKLVDEAGEDGSDFKNIYHAGLMARAHFPLELFAEASVLPSREISDVSVENKTFGIGWNAGSYFGLPLDLAIGANLSSSDVSFEQVINNSSTSNTDVNSEIKLNAKSQVYWVGVSKTLLFFTPYVKAGVASTETDVKVDASTGDIFAYTDSQKQNVSSSGSYLALGANIEFFLIRLGFEISQTAGVGRGSAKLALSF